MLFHKNSPSGKIKKEPSHDNPAGGGSAAFRRKRLAFPAGQMKKGCACKPEAKPQASVGCYG
jgi:hypothetical protein